MRRNELEEVRKTFGSTDLVVIGRKIRWAAGRYLIRSISLKEKRKFRSF
jgi:hypothetical protein